MTAVNVVGETHTFKSPPLWGKASLSVIGKECLILHDRYHTAIVVYDNWSSLIHELEQYIARRSKTEPVQVLGSSELHLTSQYYPRLGELDEGLVLRMGLAAVMLTQSSCTLLLGLLKGPAPTKKETPATSIVEPYGSPFSRSQDCPSGVIEMRRHE